ncbi:MAG: hypothetical protein R3208_18800, partial [Ketobacteraceae bacterium]|nr:hypothetical protein [Ketobacteraceae bacterium]
IGLYNGSSMKDFIQITKFAKIQGFFLVGTHARYCHIVVEGKGIGLCFSEGQSIFQLNQAIHEKRPLISWRQQ